MSTRNSNPQQPALLNQPEQTAAFTGYRPQKLPRGCSASVQMKLSQLLTEQVYACYAKGFRVFLNGSMAGWDVLAGEAVLRLRDSLPELKCVTVAPFKKDFFANDIWAPEWKARALNVYCHSDKAFALSEEYHKGIYYTRDRFLVDHASLLIAYYDGKPGGTKYTYDYAVKKHLKIINIAQQYQQGNI